MISYLKRRLKQFLLKRRYKGVWFHPTSNIQRSSTFEGGNKIHAHTTFGGNLGFCSYIGGDCQIYGRIGRFTSIAPFVKVVPGIHPYTYPFATTSPVFFSTMKQCGFSYADQQMFDEFRWADSDGKDCVRIGNDVWIQTGATIVSGVIIGDGAVVLAGAIVTKDVPPYAIVGGIPAKVMRYRYTPEDIDFLLKLRWWDKGELWWKENWRLLNDIEQLKKI